MWQIIAKNWQMKLMALMLGVLVWMYANSVVTKTTQIVVYFDVSAPSTVDVVLPVDRRVVVTASGPTGVIDELPQRNIRMLLSVGDVKDVYTDRTDYVRFTEKMVTNLPPQVQVVRFRPAGLDMTLRPLATWTFPVNPPGTVGKPAAGYEVGRAEIRGRAYVTVSGPATVLQRIRDQLKAVDPEPVDVTNRSEPVIDRARRIQTTVRLDNETERIQCDDVVEVCVDIRHARVQGVIRAVPISVLVAPASSTEVEITSDNPVDLAVEGPLEIVGTLTPEQIRAFIDVRKRKPVINLPFSEKLVVEGLPEGVRLTREIVVTAKFSLSSKPRPVPGR